MYTVLLKRSKPGWQVQIQLSLASRAFVPAGPSAAISSAVFVPSGSVDGLPPTSRDTWKRTQGPPFSDSEKAGQSERCLSTCKGSKRSCIVDNPVNANRKNQELPPMFISNRIF